MKCANEKVRINFSLRSADDQKTIFELDYSHDYCFLKPQLQEEDAVGLLDG